MLTPGPIPPLDDARADLWCVRPEDCADARLLDEYRGLMDEEEEAQFRRFRVEAKRREHLVSRALLRTVLSHYAPAAPREWRFRTGPHGKPSLVPAPDGTGAGLEFNLSHTEGLVVCLVALGCAVGVDAEDRTRRVDYLGLARRFFAPSEAAFLEGLPPEQQPDAFFRFWTLKEAYVKARGQGLLIPLASFAFTLCDGGTPGFALAEPGADDPAEWQFRELRLGERHQVALALRRPCDAPLRIALRAAVPLRSAAGPEWF